MPTTPEDVLRMARDKGTRMVDLKFTDLVGTWQHFSVPMPAFDEAAFSEGIGFDGSSIRGFQEINESDMLLFPDPDTAVMDPFTAEPTLSLVCDVNQPGPRPTPYTRDPRHVAAKAQDYLQRTGIADTAYFGPEAEFFVFDEVRYISTQNEQLAIVDSDEAYWNSSRNGSGQGGAEPGPPHAPQGRLLPRRPQRHAARPAHGDGAGDGGLRHRRRGAPPRGGRRRAVRDRYALRRAAPHGR